MILFLAASLALAEDVYVSSNVKGAAIFLNGVDTGLETPATLTGVAPGTVQIAVAAGCLRGEAAVTVKKGTANRASLMATADYGVLVVKPEPGDMRIFVDDEPYAGRPGTPFEMECGEHVVRGEADGFIPATYTVEMTGGERVDLPIVLAKGGLATLDVSVQPRSATLLLDGEKVGSDSVSLPSVTPGDHTIGARLSGYKDASVQVDVTDGESQVWHFELAADKGKKESTATRLDKGGKTVTASGGGAVADDEPASGGTSKSSSSGGSATKSSSSKSSGGDYYSRHRTGEDASDDGAADAADSSSSSKSSTSSSSSSKSTSSSSGSSSKSTRYDLDEDEPSSSSGASKSGSTKADKPEKAAKADKPGKASSSGTSGGSDKKSKVGLDVTGTALMVLGAGGGGAAVYFWDRTSTAYGRYNVKMDAAEAADDADLVAEANEYYDSAVVPTRNLMFASAGGGVALLATGLILVLVDDKPLPMIVPTPHGGAMLTWSVGF